MRRSPLRRVLTTSAITVGVLALGASAAAADTYEVRSGDTLASIARDHDQVSSWKDLYAANKDKLSDPHLILPGQQLALSGESAPAETVTGDSYTVQAGDTLASIARQTSGSWQQLAEANGLSNPHLIFVGQNLDLTVGAASTGSSGSADTSTASSEDTSGSSTDSASTDDSGGESTPSATETSGSVSTSTWDALAECESNGNWSINTGNGYYGGLQFALSSWEWVGGSGYPHEASKQEQIHRAEILLERQGWDAWPACSSMLGLR